MCSPASASPSERAKPRTSPKQRAAASSPLGAQDPTRSRRPRRPPQRRPPRFDASPRSRNSNPGILLILGGEGGGRQAALALRHGGGASCQRQPTRTSYQRCCAKPMEAPIGLVPAERPSPASTNATTPCSRRSATASAAATWPTNSASANPPSNTTSANSSTAQRPQPRRSSRHLPLGHRRLTPRSRPAPAHIHGSSFARQPPPRRPEALTANPKGDTSREGSQISDHGYRTKPVKGDPASHPQPCAFASPATRTPSPGDRRLERVSAARTSIPARPRQANPRPARLPPRPNRTRRTRVHPSRLAARLAQRHLPHLSTRLSSIEDSSPPCHGSQGLSPLRRSSGRSSGQAAQPPGGLYNAKLGPLAAAPPIPPVIRSVAAADDCGVLEAEFAVLMAPRTLDESLANPSNVHEDGKGQDPPVRLSCGSG